jgi:hypothetical protein
MEISIRIEKRADGQILPRLVCFVKRSHETKAKCFRKWHATQKSAEAQKWEIQRVLKDKDMDGVADLLLGEAQKPTVNRRMTGGAIQIFIYTKWAVEREERTVHDLESRLKPIKAKFGLCEVHMISAMDLQQLLNDQAGKQSERIRELEREVGEWKEYAANWEKNSKIWCGHMVDLLREEVRAKVRAKTFNFGGN